MEVKCLFLIHGRPPHGLAMALHLAEKKYSTQKSFHAINGIKAVDSMKYSEYFFLTFINTMAKMEAMKINIFM